MNNKISMIIQAGYFPKKYDKLEETNYALMLSDCMIKTLLRDKAVALEAISRMPNAYKEEIRSGLVAGIAALSGISRYSEFELYGHPHYLLNCSPEISRTLQLWDDLAYSAYSIGYYEIDQSIKQEGIADQVRQKLEEMVVEIGGMN